MTNIPRRRRSLAAGAAFWLCLGSQGALAQSYQVTDLGTPGGTGSYSDPHGINASGAVIGEWEPTNSVFQRAFYSYQGTSVDLGGAGNAIAYGINSSNQVVGESGVSFTHAFIYSNGAMSDLGTYAGTYSVAWAINTAGQAVGESTDSALPNAQVRALWWHGGVKTPLGVLAGGDYSSARGINDAGVIVGESSSSVAAGITNTYAFVYTNGAMQSLGSFPGGNYSSARAINNAGQIAGEAGVSGGETHAFIYTNGVMADLGTFGGNYSTAAGINSSGRVVGYALTAAGDAHAFLFNGSALLDLNNLIMPSSVCTNLISADGINDAGQIAGSGYTPNGDYHAFLLTPGVTLAAPTVLADGQFRVTVYGLPGQSFVLQGTTNLAGWTSISTNTLATNRLDCTDGPASNYHNRFYRALLLP